MQSIRKVGRAARCERRVFTAEFKAEAVRMVAGRRVADRSHGMHSATFYQWRAQFGSLDVSLVARMEELEDESRRLVDLSRSAECMMRALTNSPLGVDSRDAFVVATGSSMSVMSCPLGRSAAGFSRTAFNRKDHSRTCTSNASITTVRYDGLSQTLFESTADVQGTPPPLALDRQP